MSIKDADVILRAQQGGCWLVEKHPTRAGERINEEGRQALLRTARLDRGRPLRVHYLREREEVSHG